MLTDDLQKARFVLGGGLVGAGIAWAAGWAGFLIFIGATFVIQAVLDLWIEYLQEQLDINRRYLDEHNRP